MDRKQPMPPSKKTAPSEWLTLIAERAKALREAGVMSVRLEGCEIHLTPYEMAPPPAPPPDPLYEDALSDPATYGLLMGGHAPGFTRSFVEDEE